MMSGAYRHGLLFCTAVMALLGLLSSSCASDTSGGRSPASSAASTSTPAAEIIASLVDDWLTTLTRGSTESGSLSRFMAAPSFELSLVEGEVRSLVDLEKWRAHLHSTHDELSFGVGPVTVEGVGEGVHRARFVFERRSVDRDGLPHIASREQVWLVRIGPGAASTILRIDEQPILAFTGTGPQIVCY